VTLQMVRLTLDLGSESTDYPDSAVDHGLAERPRPIYSFTRRPKRVDVPPPLISPAPEKQSCASHSLTTERDVLLLVPRQCIVELVK
jgi:hypothetical protein